MRAHAATRAIGRARPELGLAHFRVHDLRRTVATGMASLGVNPHTISLVLDHISATKGTVTSAICEVLLRPRKAGGSRAVGKTIGNKSSHVQNRRKPALCANLALASPGESATEKIAVGSN